MSRFLPSANAREHTRGRGFTIIELLVVITIITIIVLIALPRFSAMISSQEEQLAVNLLGTAMKSGRDAAMRSGGDDDAAIVFFYRPAAANSGTGGRMVLMPCVKVGTFLDDPRRVGAGGNGGVNDVRGELRDVFVPVTGFDPIVMPRNWMVRGYAPPNSIQPAGEWYESGASNRYQQAEGNWVFPETDFYDHAKGRVGNDRQTFMVRFKAGTGEVVTVPNSTAIVIDVRPNYENRPSGDPSWALYNAYDRVGFVRKALRQGGSARQLLFGSDNSGQYSSDTVLVRPVGQLALYDETKLAAALGAQTSPGSCCLYRPPPDPNGVIGSSNDPTSDYPAFVNGVDSIKINQWIEGDTNFNNRVEGPDGRDGPTARVFSLDRYSGEPRQLEVQP